MGNAAFVSAFSFAAGCIILGVSLPAGSIPGLAVVILVAAFSCTGLGLTNAAVSLRVRENAVLSNVIFGFLLIFTGANVPISELPGWMQDISHVIPLTHAIQAARDLAAGEPFSDVTGLLATELGIGLTYLVGGLVLLRVFEWQGRKHATLEQLVSHSFRLFWTGWVFNVKNLTMSGFFILNATISPIFFATIAHYMFAGGARPGSGLLYASLGAGMMGIWSSVLFGSGGLIQWQRWQGTLEYVIGVPPRLIAVVLPMTVATASIGLYSIASTLLWGRVIFGLPLDFVHPAWFLVALVAAIVSLGLLGLVLSSTFVLLRNANSLSNLLEYPVWLVTGLLISLSLLPGWTRPISWVLAPTWGIRGLRAAALGGDPVVPFLMCVALGLIYLAIGHYTLGYFERARLARETSARDAASLRPLNDSDTSRALGMTSASSSSAATSPTARSSTGSTGRCTCRRCSAGRSSRSSSSPTSGATPGRSPTSSSSSAMRSPSARWAGSSGWR